MENQLSNKALAKDLELNKKVLKVKSEVETIIPRRRVFDTQSVIKCMEYAMDLVQDFKIHGYEKKEIVLKIVNDIVHEHRIIALDIEEFLLLVPTLIDSYVAFAKVFKKHRKYLPKCCK